MEIKEKRKGTINSITGSIIRLIITSIILAVTSLNEILSSLLANSF